MADYKPTEVKDVTQGINVDDIPQEQVDAFEKYLESMTQEEARAFAANFGDPSVDYSKVDFSKPEE